MCVCCECCVLSGRGLYDELINHTEESTDCGVSECDQVQQQPSAPTMGRYMCADKSLARPD